MTDIGRTKQLFSQTMIYGLGIMLNRSVSFILIPVYTKYFSPAELGVFTLVQSLSIFLGFVYALGLETAFMKKFIDAVDIERRKNIYSSTLIFLLLSSVTLSFLLYIFAGRISEIIGISDSPNSVFLIQLMGIVMIADTLYRIPMLLFRAQLRAKMYSLLNLLAFIINVGLNLILIVKLNFGVEAIFYSYLASVIVILILTLFMTRENITSSFSKETISEMLAYGAKFIFIGIFLLVIDMSDRFFLQHYFGESTVGIYWANYRLASVMGLVIAAFKFSWTPFFLNLNKEHASRKVIAYVTTYFVFAGSILFLIFGLLIDVIAPAEIFGVRFLDVLYLPGLSIVPVILLSYFFSGLYSTFNAAPFFTDNTKSLLYITGAGVIINILLNFFLIPKFEMQGAAIATLITYFTMFLMVFFYSQKIYRIELDYLRITIIFLGAVGIFVIGYFVVNRTELSLGIKAVIDIGMVVLYLVLLNITGMFRLSRVTELLKKS
jgi:O-antigen/teichoic acid export membrane protein